MCDVSVYENSLGLVGDIALYDTYLYDELFPKRKIYLYIRAYFLLEALAQRCSIIFFRKMQRFFFCNVLDMNTSFI